MSSDLVKMCKRLSKYAHAQLSSRDLERIANRIEGLEAKLAWQPIETAPLDTPILLYGWWGWNEPADCQTTQIGISRLNEWDADDVVVYWESITCNPYKDEGKPTHWMPLPVAPAELKGQNDE